MTTATHALSRPKPATFAWAVLCLCALAACDDRTVAAVDGSAADSAAARDAGGPLAETAPKGDASTSPAACIIAVRFPECCATIVVGAAKELAADPCLLRWPAKRPAQCPQTCRAACAEPAPESRVATRGSDGVCRFSHECQSASDCQISANGFACCDCGGAFPKAFVAQHPCYHGDKAGCLAKCAPGSPQCDCAKPSYGLKCALDGAFKRCVPDTR